MDKTALFSLSYGLYVIGVRTKEGMGGCIVDAFMQAADTPPVAVLSCGNRSCTNERIHSENEFVLSVLPANVDPMVIANFGYQSARTADKWANVSHTLWHDLPVLSQCCATLHMKVRETMELPTHTLFVLDILDTAKGSGEPLLYNEYQRSMKQSTMEAYRALQNKSL